MKNLNVIAICLSLCTLSFIAYSFKPADKGYEFKTMTVVESLVPNGIGRSRIINSLAPRDYSDYTKVMTPEDKSRNKSDRGDIRVENYEETKLLNFYNVGGIRFQNIAANDAVVDSRVNAFLDQGWELININTGVEAFAGKGDNNALFITRFYFKKPK